MKKIIALVLALCMVATLGLAFADDTPTPTNNVTGDGSVSVTGLDSGDQVNLFQLINWVQNTGWDYTASVKSAAEQLSVTLPDLETITGKWIDNPEGEGKIFQQGKISVADAATFASLASKLTAIDGGTVAAGTDYVTKAVETGLFMALVTPGNPETLYNPIFVASDYDRNATNTQAAELDKSYSPKAMAKKETVTLTKEINENTNFAQQAVNAGEKVSFTITSKVPAFSGAYVDPEYVITDTTEDGLTISGTPAVTVTGIELTATDYKTTVTGKNTFKVEMTAAGLKKVAATGLAQTITVTYDAILENIDALTVTEKDNEATVKFSNNPGDSSSYSLLEDKTKTYSFSIDSKLFGKTGSDYITNELVKVGLNADGSIKTDTKEYHSDTEWTTLSPLQGAEFKLYTAKTCNDDEVYSNSKFNGTVYSDPSGLLNIVGLDEGTYYLKETKAPEGYIKDIRVFEIIIDADYTKIDGGKYQKNVGTTEDPEMVWVKFDEYYVLKSYTVTVKDADTGTTIAASDYSFTNVAEEVHHTDLRTDLDANGFAGDDETAINNTQGVELPSTGGIGTTIFYILGGLLVVGAAVILVARRKAQD